MKKICSWCKKNTTTNKESNSCKPCLVKRQIRENSRIERTSQFIATARGDRDMAKYI